MHFPDLEVCCDWSAFFPLQSADVRGAGTRDQPLTTSAWEASEAYIRKGDPTTQQGSDSVSTPPSPPPPAKTPQQELDPVPSPYQTTVPESTAGLLDRGECPDLHENVGAAPEPSRNLRPQRTRRLPERLKD